MTKIEIEYEGWTVKAELEWKYAGKSGIGHYEFQGQTGFDEGFDEYEYEDITITEAIDPDGNSFPISDLTKDLISEFNFLLEREAVNNQP